MSPPSRTELRLSQAAMRAGLPAWKLREAVQRGTLAGRLTETGRYLIEVASLEAFIERRPTPEQRRPESVGGAAA